MRQILIPKYGKPNVFTIVEKEICSPKEGEVQIKVHAAGVNFADILARKGLYPDAPKAPLVVGYEVSGIVEKVGENVDGEWIGKPVFSLTHFGGYSEFVNVPQSQIFVKPENISFEQAAAIPVNYLTAFLLIVVMGGLGKNETILIHNAGGGVGLAALELAKNIGAKIIGTASPQKHAFLYDKGFDALVNYRKANWPDEIQKLTNNMGVELVLDPIGGKNWKINLSLLRSTGRLGMYGISSVTESSLAGFLKFLGLMTRMPVILPLTLMNKNRGTFGVNLAQLWDETNKVADWMNSILTGIKGGWISPHVDKVFFFKDAALAHQYIEDRQNIGKVILVP
jgi:synaptic vesicle membrane protein VAT-1